MADVTVFDRRTLERLFDMGGGYVLNFSDRTFGEFFMDYQVDIDADKYRESGTSKANRLRSFWVIETNHIVGRLIEALINYGIHFDCLATVPNLDDLIEEGRKIATRLQSGQPVAEIGALIATVDDKDFEAVAQHIKEAIEKNQPEAALDRLHTFVIKFNRALCEEHGIVLNKDKPLHSAFGEYVKALRDEGLLESVMTERILKSSISVLEAFNDVRNNQSLAHDNPILNYEESLLIFNHVAASIRFIKAVASRKGGKSK